MKRILLIFSCLIAFTSTFAQPSWTKKMSKALFVLKTFSKDGQLLGSASGVFVGTDGMALSNFSPFKGASRAVVIDAAGKEYEVVCLMGANETYDVAKFKVGGVKKVQAAEMAQERLAVGAQAWLVPYKNVKQTRQGAVSKVETFNQQYAYYTVALPMTDLQAGAPLFNGEGQMVGVAMPPVTDTDSLCYVVSALFADSLKTTGLSLNDPVLRSTGIKKALPADQSQALLALFIGQSQLDAAAYTALIDDFIAQFPASQDGFVYRAQNHIRNRDYQSAEADMAQALKVAQRKDEVHFSYSRLVVDAMANDSAVPPSWNLEKAFDEAQTATSVRDLGIYRQQQAGILMAQKKYEEAYKCYELLFDSTMLQPDVYFQAARCRQLSGDTVAYLSMLDRCVEHFSKPYLREAAPYLLVRAQANLSANNYRKAVSDLNEYEKLMASQVNDNFYYVRFQAEMGGRLFQLALNDIDKAIAMNGQSDLYLSEKASLLVRVGYYDDAIETARRCVELAPSQSDGYLFLGLAQCLKGQKAEGLKNLQRASELGDPQAAGLIEQYSNVEN